jgi:uncharacterized protein
MSCYVDTSVWVALLCRESAAPRIATWLAAGPAVMTSPWTQVELASALGIKARRGELSQGLVSEICAAYQRLLNRNDLTLCGVASTDYQEAVLLCENIETGLRAGDALHLAVAQRCGANRFFSFDQRLNTRAKACGLELIAV